MTVPNEITELRKKLEAVERGDEKLTDVSYSGSLEKKWIQRNLTLVKKGRQSIIEFMIQLNKLIKAIELF